MTPRHSIAMVCALAGLLSAGCSPPHFDNVVLVTIDTLRADHLGCYGYPRPTSPFIDSLAARGVRFESAISASGSTAPSHASIFTSYYAARHGVLRNGIPLPPDVPTLASLMQDNGIETAAVTSVRFLEGVANGFETVRLPPTDRYRPASRTVNEAIAWFDSRVGNRRFALWVHLYDVHDSKRAAIVKAELREHLEVMRSDAATRGKELPQYLSASQGVADDFLKADFDRFNRYDAQIRLVDSQIERLFGAISGGSDDEATLWIIMADHGEGLGSHDEMGHDRHLYDEQTDIPLIFYGGSSFGGGLVVSSLVRSVDVFPTVFHLMDLTMDSSEPEWDGRSLRGLLAGAVEAAEPRVAFAQRGPPDVMRLRRGWVDESLMMARTADAKYIRHTAGDDEFYDLASDPLEKTNLAGQGSDAERRLARWLAEKLAFMSNHPLPGARVAREVDDKFVAELRALGYIE